MIEQGTPDWFQQRLGKATASRIADIIAKTKTGVSASRGNYLMELALQRVTNSVQESFKNDAMQWGTDTEPFARIAYEARTGNFVDQISFIDHPTIAWAGASPDGLIGDNGLLEIKCPNSATHWATLKSKEIPGKYQTQMLWQLACTGREWNDFVSFDPRMPERSQLFIKRLERDEQKIKELETEVSIFLEEVATEVERMTNYQE